MTFVQRNSSLDVGESLDQIFRMISTRNASFEEMTLDEKLASIANLIENLLKENSSFVKLDYKPIAFSFIDDDTIKRFRKQIQCFRHSARDSLAERRDFTDEQKGFLVDYGIVICKSIHAVKASG